MPLRSSIHMSQNPVKPSQSILIPVRMKYYKLSHFYAQIDNSNQEGVWRTVRERQGH